MKVKKKRKNPLVLGVWFMWKEHLTSHIPQLLAHVRFHHFWCNHSLLMQGCWLRRTEWILASLRGALLETQHGHCFPALQTATVESGHVMAKPVKFSHCSIWHMVLSGKHLALTLKAVLVTALKLISLWKHNIVGLKLIFSARQWKGTRSLTGTWQKCYWNLPSSLTNECCTRGPTWLKDDTLLDSSLAKSRGRELTDLMSCEDGVRLVFKKSSLKF